MAVGLKFPEDPDALVQTLRQIVAAGEPARNREKVRWQLVMLYLQGVRNFTSLDWNTGSVSVEYPVGSLRDQDFRFDKIVGIYETQMGRLLQADFSPVVARLSQGLDDLRKASTAQVLLDHALSKEDAALLKLSLIPPFLRGGHVGIGAFANEGTPRIEYIPGWELGSIPSNPVSSEAIEGIYRIRWVTYNWLLENNIIKKDDAQTRSLLNLRSAPIGHAPPNDLGFSVTQTTDTAQGFSQTRSDQKKAAETKGTAEWTTFLEVWIRDKSDYLQEVIVMAGKKVIEELHQTGIGPLRRPMPIQIARYIDTGSFYGRGMLEQFIPLNNEVEFMLQQLFREVENFDIYGFLCVGAGMGLSLETIQEARNGDKVLVYSPDPMAPTAVPFNLPPSNANKLPIGVVQMAIGLMDAQSSQSDLFSGDAPGRVDNAKALSFLFETANIPLTAPMESLSIALSRSYRALLYLIKEQWGEKQTISMSLNDDILVGVKYDSVSGQLTLDRNAIPHPDEVLITVSSKMPKSIAQRKAELAEHLAAAVITPREYRTMSRVEGLDLPVANEREWQAFRKAKMENIMLFGDGEKPGQIAPSPRDYHEVHLEVLGAFMARPEYSLASSDIQDEFAAHYKFHQENLGTYPEDIPYPETQAEGEPQPQPG